MSLDSKFDIYLKQSAVNNKSSAKPGFHPPKIGYLRNTDSGEIWVVDWIYNSGYLHGKYELSCIDNIHDIVDSNSSGFNPSQATVIDTETTGLAGGTGTYAFIIGAGFWRENEFVIRQFMMRDFNEEPAQLLALAEDFSGSVITYNGKCFDIPLLTNRYRLHRFDSPFENIQHLDMLFPCRRIWKRNLSGFKLTQIEEMILGYAREDDIPSHMIPSIFFDYLQVRDEKLLYPILHHNRDDVLSLYHLTCIASDIVSRSFDIGSNSDDLLLSLAEICFNQKRYELAIDLTDKANRDFTSKMTLKQASQLKALAFKKLGKWEDAVNSFSDMFDIEPEVYSSIELAKLFEHKLRDPVQALDIVKMAEALLELLSYMGLDTSKTVAELIHRKNRLQRKIAHMLQS